MHELSAIRDFVKRLLRRIGDDAPFRDDESLVLSGRIDSVGVLEIVMYLEGQYGLDLDDHGFDQTMVDSVNDIAALIQSTAQAR